MSLAAIGDTSDVTNSPAFLSLDTLLEEGKIVEERALQLKKRFKELHDRVLQIHSNEMYLTTRARRLRTELDAELLKVEKCGEVALTDDTSIKQLKTELAEAEHELSIAQEKESMLQVEALELDRKKQTLTHDVEESIAQEEAKLKPLIEKFQTDIKQLGDDIASTGANYSKLQEQREKLLAREAQLKETMEKQNGEIYETKLEFARVEREPERGKKQADIVAKAHQTAQKELNGLNDKLAAMKALHTELTDKSTGLSTQHDDLYKTLETNRAGIAQCTKYLDSITTNLELEREQYAKYQRRFQELEGLLKAAAIAMNTERENLNRTLRDKEQGMKMFKKLEQTKSDLMNDSEICRKQSEILHREEQRLDTARQQCSADLEDLKRDVDILINNFLKEEIAEKRCITDKEEMQRLITDMEDDVRARTLDEQQQRRRASDLGIQREQMSRECSRTQARVQLALGQLKVKDVEVVELNKRYDDLMSRLNESMEKYGAVKRERSAKAQLIQSASQTMSETQEKIKILENELEVLRRESLIKDQDLAKKRREAHEHRQSCKNLRVKRNKINKRLEEKAHRQSDLEQQMSKLNSIITATEDDMLALKKAYEDAVENRNYTGIQLIDRNDELCILYEKANVQESILKRGLVMLNKRVDEIRATAIELADLQREIDLCQTVLPQVRDMEEELASMLMQLEEERWRAETLENDLTDPNNASRWRNVSKVGSGKNISAVAADASTTAAQSKAGGGDEDAMAGPSEDFVELTEKQQNLEERLAAVNERLMEKELILEEISELSNRLRRQALSGRDFTLALAKKVNGYQFGIKRRTKHMMAILSELSMVQASTLKLEEDVSKAEEHVTAARQRAEQGAAPSDDIELQYQRQRAHEQRRREVMLQRKERLATETGAPDLRTTAEKRANAYIPDSDLGLPKPYGSHAPFRPNMDAQATAHRFYRRPGARPVVIDDEEDGQDY